MTCEAVNRLIPAMRRVRPCASSCADFERYGHIFLAVRDGPPREGIEGRLQRVAGYVLKVGSDDDAMASGEPGDVGNKAPLGCIGHQFGGADHAKTVGPDDGDRPREVPAINPYRGDDA